MFVCLPTYWHYIFYNTAECLLFSVAVAEKDSKPAPFRIGSQCYYIHSIGRWCWALAPNVSIWLRTYEIKMVDEYTKQPPTTPFPSTSCGRCQEKYCDDLRDRWGWNSPENMWSCVCCLRWHCVCLLRLLSTIIRLAGHLSHADRKYHDNNSIFIYYCRMLINIFSMCWTLQCLLYSSLPWIALC